MTTETRPETDVPANASAFATPEKAARYDSERYHGATGLNWYASDPSLQRALRFYMQPRDFDWVQPHLDRWGALMGGPVSERAEETDRNPPRLVKYDRWGQDVSEVLIPESAQQTKRDVIANRMSSPELVEAARAAGVRTDFAGMA